MEILKNYVMRVQAKSGGKSKWLTPEQIKVINSLNAGEAVILPVSKETIEAKNQDGTPNDKPIRNMAYCVKKTVRATTTKENGREYAFGFTEENTGFIVKLVKTNEVPVAEVPAEEDEEIEGARQDVEAEEAE